MIQRIMGYIFILLLFISSISYGSELRNIALGRIVEFNVKPNNSECSNSKDMIELTDGIKKGSFARSGSTVGWDWRHISREKTGKEGKIITIDLGYEREYEEVRIYMRRWTGDWSTVEIFTAGENKNFRLVKNELDALKGTRKISWWKGYAHTIVIPVGKVSGRYVKIIIKGDGVIDFLDEIEILSASESSLEIKEKKQLEDGSYKYVIKNNNNKGISIQLKGKTPTGDVIFETKSPLWGNTQKTENQEEITFSFKIPKELCHIAEFNLIDNKGQ